MVAPLYPAQAKVDDEGLCRFGWATLDAGLNLGTDAFGYGFGGTGMKSHAGKFEKYGEPFHQGDTVGCRLDLCKVIAQRMKFSLSNRSGPFPL